jgi:hypothetical protein
MDLRQRTRRSEAPVVREGSGLPDTAMRTDVRPGGREVNGTAVNDEKPASPRNRASIRGGSVGWLRGGGRAAACIRAPATVHILPSRDTGWFGQPASMYAARR